jgi:hypothetical protein
VTRLALAVLVACAAPPKAVEPATVAPTPWCFRIRFSFDGRAESGLACGSTRDVCMNAQRRAVRFGSWMQAKEVGACRR